MINQNIFDFDKKYFKVSRDSINIIFKKATGKR